MVKIKQCAYCKKSFTTSDGAQRFCCKSCKNCSNSYSRMCSADSRKLITASGYYATENGRNEVERGLHDETLRRNSTTREDWLAKWTLKAGNIQKQADAAPPKNPAYTLNKEVPFFNSITEYKKINTSGYGNVFGMHSDMAKILNAKNGFLDKISSEKVKNTYFVNQTVIGLDKGRLVHMVKLTATRPARPVDVKFNFILPRDISFKNANILCCNSLDEPAGWFIQKDFIVRSMKENDFWYQLAYKDTNQKTWLCEEIVNEYFSFAKLKRNSL